MCHQKTRVLIGDEDFDMDLPEKILELLDKSSKPVSSVELAEKLNVDYQKIVGAIKSLEALGDYVNTTTETQKTWALTGNLESAKVCICALCA